MESKQCTKCGEVKPLDEFKKNSRVISGRANVCKECARESNRAYRERNPVKEQDAKRAREYKNPRVFYKHNPDAQAAHHRVNNRIRAGLMPKASEFVCNRCGNHATEYHHPNGYGTGHEFDVIPLCRSCHRLIHSVRS